MSDKYVSQLSIGGNLYKFRTGSVGTNADTVDGKHASDFVATEFMDRFSIQNGLCALAPVTDLNDIYWNSFYNFDSHTGNSPVDAWGFVLTFAHAYGNHYASQVVIPMNGSANTIYIRRKSSGTWRAWTNISSATGGDADTVDGKHASDFAAVKKLITMAEVDSILEPGIYSVENVYTTFGSISSSFYMLIVNQHRIDMNYNTELAIPYVNGYQQGVYYRNCANGAWGTWTNVADGGNADTVDGKHASDFMTTDFMNRFVMTNGLSATCPVGDLNDIAWNSIYNCNNDFVANCPIPKGFWSFVITLAHSNSAAYITQIVVSMNSTEAIYMRQKIAGVWYPWVKTNDNGNADSVDGYHFNSGTSATPSGAAGTIYFQYS